MKEVMEKNSGLISERPRTALVDSVFGERSSGWTHCCERTFCYHCRTVYPDDSSSPEVADIAEMREGTPHIPSTPTTSRDPTHRSYSTDVRHIKRAYRKPQSLNHVSRNVTIRHLRPPQSFYHHIRRYATSTGLSVVFGKRTPKPTAPEVTDLSAIQRGLDRLADPGAIRPIDLIPILRYFSGGWSKWRELANQIKRLEETLFFKLYEGVIANINAGKKSGCWMETVVEHGPGVGLSTAQMA